MGLPRVRFTVRAMMVAVAIIASGLAYFHHKKSAAFRLVAEANARKAGDYAAKARQSERIWKEIDGSLGYGVEYLTRRQRIVDWTINNYEDMIDNFRQDFERHQKLFTYYKGLEDKYRRAATNPWLPVAPDPAPPPVIAAPTAVARRKESDSPSSITIVPSLSRKVFEFGEHPLFGRAVPLTIEYHNDSDRPVTICPIGLAVVIDERGQEPELTGQGRRYQEAFQIQFSRLSPGETRRKHASIVLQPGGSYRDEGLDLAGLYRFPPGRYAVRVIWDDPPLGAVSAPLAFEIKRVKRRY